ncbi:MAG: mechanosensitive ion channel [Ruminococcus sp.]|nr:mechanosensitive ion channel [Ruminococcus sp.]
MLQGEVDKASGFLSGAADYIKAALPAVILALLILIAGLLVSKLITHIVSRAMNRSKIDGAAKGFLVSVVRTVLYVIVLIMVLSALNIPTTSIITLFGAAGIAVSLALQSCLSNLCGGFIILFSKPFSAGDTVELDGTVGVVETIGILYTRILTYDSKTVFIPNGNITQAKIVNYTNTPNRRIELTFDIAYSADHAKARELILAVLSGNKRLLDTPEPVVRMSAHKESSVAIDVLVWTANADYFTARYDIIEGVKAAFDEGGIEIPYPQLDVHIKPEGTQNV